MYFLDLSDAAVTHATWPRNYGQPEAFTGHACITGPCGDTMEFWVQVDDGRVLRASFITDGCSSSLAAGSAATCLAVDQDLEQVLAVQQRDVLELLGKIPTEWEHCALLAANTLKSACEDHLERHPQTSAELPSRLT